MSISRSRQPDFEPSDTTDMLSYGELEIDTGGRRVLCRGESVELTYREFDLLSYLVRHHKNVLKRGQLLENIWGYDYMGNSRAVDISIKRLRTKLGSCGEYIKTVYGVGYKFEVP